MNRMILTVPAGKEWSLVVRTTLGAVGVMANLSLDVVDDLRTAVEESFELITHQERMVDRVSLLVKIEAGYIHITLKAQRAQHSQECDKINPEVAQLIIGTLVTDVQLEGDQCGIHTVRMALPAGE
jgi:anti-sigma regulatory factor (Ser/Thr protein kinase)